MFFYKLLTFIVCAAGLPAKQLLKWLGSIPRVTLIVGLMFLGIVAGHLAQSPICLSAEYRMLNT